MIWPIALKSASRNFGPLDLIQYPKFSTSTNNAIFVLIINRELDGYISSNSRSLSISLNHKNFLYKIERRLIKNSFINQLYSSKRPGIAADPFTYPPSSYHTLLYNHPLNDSSKIEHFRPDFQSVFTTPPCGHVVGRSGFGFGQAGSGKRASTPSVRPPAATHRPAPHPPAPLPFHIPPPASAGDAEPARRCFSHHPE